MINHILKKHSLFILVSSVLLFICVVLVKNIYISTLLMTVMFGILPYFIVYRSLIAINQTKEHAGGDINAGFLSGGVVNLLLSFFSVVGSFRELIVIIRDRGNSPLIYSGQTLNEAIFSGISSIIIFPLIMFFIGGLSGHFASHTFYKTLSKIN